MNANRYRLILDKRTGTLIPVADFVTRAKKGRGGARGADGEGEGSEPSGWGRVRMALLLALGAWIPLQGTAQVAVNPSGAYAPEISDTANQTPLINIVDPNANGLSHNRFVDFNVGGQGVVFNNSMQDGMTQIGGHAMKNPNLTRSASGILAEVTGAQQSSLQGAMEVFGPTADLLIANPNGLYVNGLSTINASQLLLTTGRPVGDGRQFEVLGGQVNLAGPVSTAGLSHFDVVARSIALHGVVSGSADATLVAGLNHYDATTRAVTKHADGAADAPAFAIQGSAVGALHGSHVKLISTESGLGVRHEGLVVSSADLAITADGDVSVRRLQSAANAQVTGRNVQVGGVDGAFDYSGMVQSELRVNASGEVALQGRYSVENANVGAQSIRADEVRLVAGRRTADGRATVTLQGERVTLNGGHWEAHDRIQVSGGEAVIGGSAWLTAQELDLEVRDDLRVQNHGAHQPLLQAGTNLTVGAGRLFNDGTFSAMHSRYVLDALHNGAIGTLQSVALEIALGTGASTNAGVVYAHELDLRGSGSLENQVSGLLLSEGGIDLALDALDNRGVIDANGVIQVAVAGRLDNRGTLSTRSALGLSAGELINRDQGTVYAAGNVDLQVRGDVHNLGQGMIVSEGDLTLSADGDLVQVGQMVLDEHGRPVLDAQGQPVIDRPTLGAGGTMTVSVGGNIDQIHADLYGRDVNLVAGGSLTNDASRIDADHLLDVRVGGDTHNVSGASMVGKEVIFAGGGSLVNRGATLASTQGDMALTLGGDLSNEGGAYLGATGGDLDLVADGALNNTGSALVTTQDLRVQLGDAVRNDAGQILVQRDATLVAQSLDNARGGTIHAGRNAALDTRGDLINRDGSVLRAGWVLDGKVGGDLHNTGNGSLIRGEYVDLVVDGAVDNRDKALIHATSALALQAQRLANTDARLLAGQVLDDGSQIAGDMDLTLRGDVESLQGGQITALGDLSLDAQGNVRVADQASIAARSAWMTADGNLDVESGARIQTAEHLQVRVQNLRNAGTMTAEQMALEAGERLDNIGEVVAGSWLLGDARQLDNRGQMRARDALELSTDTYANTGTIHTAGDAMLTIKHGLDLHINDVSRGLTGDRSLTLNADDVRFDRELQNLGDIYINATGSVDNARGVIGGGSIVATVQGSLTNHDLIWAAKDVDIQAKELRNRAGAEIEAHRNVVLDIETTLTNEAGARIAARGDAKIDARTLRNEMSVTAGGAVVKSEESGYSSVTRDNHRGDKYEFIVSGLPVLGSDLRVTAQGQIQAGGNLRINQGTMKGKGAHIYNQGQLQAGGGVWVNGNVDNVGAGAFESIESYLKRDADFEIKATAHLQRRSMHFSSFYDLLDNVFSAKWGHGMGVAGYTWYSDWVANAIKEYDNPEFNKVMAHVFGADWRARDYESVLIGRWNSFKVDMANRGGFQLVADRAAELAAGGSVVKDGGYFKNGMGGKETENKPLTVTIGDEQVQTIGGSFDVRINLGDLGQALDPSLVWKDMTSGGRKFRPAPGAKVHEPIDWSVSPPVSGALNFDAPPVPVVPLYETRIEYIDQSQFFGTDYFFGKVGYVTDRTVTVIGDNYFINELVNKQINGQVGSFLSVRDRVSGTDQVKLLMDAAGEEGVRLGLQVGVAPTEEQLAALDRDIVWFVASEVDGQSVLVPTVYLSKQTLAEVNAERASGVASVAAGEHVIIDADEGGVRNNNGTIRAGKSLDITSKGEIVNAADNGMNGSLRAGDALIIDAQGDVTNLGASIEGHDVVIRTEGNFVDSVRMGYNDKGELVVGNGSRIRGGGADEDTVPTPSNASDVASSSKTSNMAMIARASDMASSSKASNMAMTTQASNAMTTSQASNTPAPTKTSHAETRAGGSVSIQAKGDITLTGSDIRAKDVLLDAGGNLASNDVHEVASTFDHTTSARALSRISVTETTSKATAVGSKVRGAADGGSLVMKAGENITLQGGEYGADMGLIQAGGDVITKTSRDYSHQKKVTVSEGFVVGARAGAGGAGAAAEFGPNGGSTGVVGGGQENPPAAGGRPVADGTHGSGKAILGETAGFQLGYERIEVTETHDTIKNKNASLDFGSSVAIIAGGTVDIGGADISAVKDELKGDVLIQGKEVISTKHEDVDRKTTHRKEEFAGLSGSGQSSVVDAVNKTKKLVDDASQEGMSVDPGMTVAQAAGDVSNMVFNDLAGGSVNLTYKRTEERSSTTERMENINTVTGNISIMSTEGDIKLAGVVLDGNGASVMLDSARAIELASAKTTVESESSRQNHQASFGVSGSVAPTGAGVGVSLGYNGGLDKSHAKGVSHTNSQIVGSEVTIRSAGDTTLKGAEVLAGRADVDVGGKLRVESVQDTYEENSSRATWGASVGAALTSQSPVGATVTGGVDAGYGESWDKSAITGQQSGIQAKELNMDVAGDVQMKGAHLIAEEGGRMNVGGTVISEKLEDFQDKDGWYGGGGGGISKSGLASVNIQLERDERISYESEQLNTISGMQVNAGGGVQGAINSDASSTENVIRDERVAGNSMSLTVGVGDIKERYNNRAAKGAAEVPQLRSRRSSTDSTTSTGSSSSTGSNSSNSSNSSRHSNDSNSSISSRNSSDSNNSSSSDNFSTLSDSGDSQSIRHPVSPDDVDVVVIEDSPRRFEMGERLSYVKRVASDTPTTQVDGLTVILDRNGQPTRRVVERQPDGSLREVGMAKIPTTIDSAGRPISVVDGVPEAPMNWPGSTTVRDSTLRQGDGGSMPRLPTVPEGFDTDGASTLSGPPSSPEPVYSQVNRQRSNPASSANGDSMPARDTSGQEPVYSVVNRDRSRSAPEVPVQDRTTGTGGAATPAPISGHRGSDYDEIPADSIPDALPGGSMNSSPRGSSDYDTIPADARTGSAELVNGIDAASADPKYDQRVIVRLEDDPTTQEAAQRLYNKHMGESVLLQRDGEGNHRTLAGKPRADGTAKVELVGHGRNTADGQVVGGLNPADLAGEVMSVRDVLGTPDIKKVTVVGCNSASCAAEVQSRLADRGTVVGGYNGSVDVNDEGQKVPVREGGLGAGDVAGKRVSFQEAPVDSGVTMRPKTANQGGTTAQQDSAGLSRLTSKGNVKVGTAKPGMVETVKGLLKGKSRATTAEEKTQRQRQRLHDAMSQPQKRKTALLESLESSGGLVTYQSQGALQEQGAANVVAVNMAGGQYVDSDGTPLSDGVYTIAALASDPAVLRGFRRDPNDPLDILNGHTSITRGADAVFAGEMYLANGRLMDWTNKSGHYRVGVLGAFRTDDALSNHIFSQTRALRHLLPEDAFFRWNEEM